MTFAALKGLHILTPDASREYRRTIEVLQRHVGEIHELMNVNQRHAIYPEQIHLRKYPR